MTNHSLTSANGKTHAKIAFLAFAISAVFMAMISASGTTWSDAVGARTAGPVITAGVATKIVANDRSMVR